MIETMQLVSPQFLNTYTTILSKNFDKLNPET